MKLPFQRDAPKDTIIRKIFKWIVLEYISKDQELGTWLDAAGEDDVMCVVHLNREALTSPAKPIMAEWTYLVSVEKCSNGL